MPATEQTWYNQKLLHTVFGFSGLALLIATVWMFAADHDREWKGYQRRFREAEQRLTTWRKSEAQSLEQQNEFAELSRLLVAAQSAPPNKYDVANFKKAVLEDAFARGEIDQQSRDAQYADVASWLNEPSSESQAFDGQFAKIDSDYRDLDLSLVSLKTDRQGVTAAESKLESTRKALAAALEQAKAVPADDAAAKEAAQAAFDAAEENLKTAEAEVDKLRDGVFEVEQGVAKSRNAFIAKLQVVMDKAQFREKLLLSQKKFRSADGDAAKAQLDIGVRDDVTAERLAELQVVVDGIMDGPGGVNEIAQKGQDATAHREKLQSLIRNMTSADAEIAKKIGDNQSAIVSLDNTFVERRSTWLVGTPPFLGKRWLELPILSAFGTPLTIDNLWTDNLKRPNGSFGEVRRFDRCTTCHQGIAKTAPGSAIEPAFRPEQQFDVVLQTPATEPVPTVDADGNEVPVSVGQVYGMELAPFGLIDDNDVTINQIVPNSLAAVAVATNDSHGNPVATGLQVGDVILYVNGDQTLDPADVEQYLLSLEWGQPATLTVRRGLPQPFTTHPKMDLFVGSLSPHPVARFGCTSCHEGQGSATDFKWVSHAPNTIAQEEQWAKDHGHFHNHHWIYPMYPKRFVESACLKCHHNVAELEASPAYPDGGAPKVVEGWHLIGQYGCYGCHEINGYDGPDQRVGPDLRLEPNYFAAAAQLQIDPAITKLGEAESMAKTLAKKPYLNETRQQLRQLILDDKNAEAPLLSKSSHNLADVLQNQDAPGLRRKSGPSLRHVALKLGEPFLYDWIREPKNFRPSSKMPQFFGLWDHLDGDDKQLAVDYERIEILGIVKYLMTRSQPMDYLEPAEGCEPGDVARGKIAFELGCIACHQHEDFPHVTSKQGPNLSNLADKFSAATAAPNAKRWMYTWVKKPTEYHSRTKMPDLQLVPKKTKDGKVVDPVADIVEYLLSSSRGWTPAKESTDHLTANTEMLNALTAELLTGTFPNRRAQQYLAEGIPAEIADTLKGAEIELVGDISDEKKLLYVGRKAISKYGCYGCHDVPGFESAKPIGAALAQWGRKESSKLAFEHILEYLHHGGHGGHGHHEAHGEGEGGHDTEHAAAEGHDSDAHAADAHADHAHEDPADVAYFENQIGLHDRSGFIWQKLREPRSYDYKKTANKKYNDRLRMPLFPITPDEREAIATFVLGLVAEPPADEFVYQPDPQELAIVEGRRVLEKYNCGGCHILEAEQWEIESLPGEIPYQVADAAVPPPFAKASFAAAHLAASEKPDARRGVIKTIVRGMPALGSDGNVLVLDEDGAPTDIEDEDDLSVLKYQFQLWEPVAYEGKGRDVGGKLTLPMSKVTRKWPARGGDLTRWLLPSVVKLEKKDNPQANGNEAWGWLPPPLLGEGKKVQPDWLHSFLLEPHAIRPAAFLRMPKFNMSPEEATQLVKYFAARDGEVFPFEFDNRMIAESVKAKETEFAAAHGGGDKTRLDHAMQIVTDGNYCVKCHLVGDYLPESSQRALAPNLADVESRLRPTYLRNWIAYPKHILPYTPMPINVPYIPDTETLGGVAQELYPGTSVDQIDGLVDLLMNFSTHVGAKYDFGALVQASAGSAGGADAGSTAEPPAESPAAEADEEEEPTASVTTSTEDEQAGNSATVAPNGDAVSVKESGEVSG